MYVLIIVTWFSGYIGGFSTTTQEFVTATSCENARAVIHQITETKPNNKYIKTICVPKN